MRILYSLFVLAFLAAAPVRAQITLTAADLQAQLKGRFATTSYFATNRQSLATVAADKGANRTWDLRAAAFALDTVLTFQVVSAPVPGSGDPFFATANQIVRSEGVITASPTRPTPSAASAATSTSRSAASPSATSTTPRRATRR